MLDVFLELAELAALSLRGAAGSARAPRCAADARLLAVIFADLHAVRLVSLMTRPIGPAAARPAAAGAPAGPPGVASRKIRVAKCVVRVRVPMKNGSRQLPFDYSAG